MRPLTVDQRATIEGLKKMRIALHWLGKDSDGHPVLWVRDRRRSMPFAVMPDGSGDVPTGLVLPPSEDDIGEMCEEDAHVILAIPLAKISDDLLKEVRHDG